jgi:hypothetical protein
MATIKTAFLTQNGRCLAIVERNGDQVINERRRFVHQINLNGGGEKNFWRYDIKGTNSENINLGNLKLKTEVELGENCYTRAEVSEYQKSDAKKAWYAGNIILHLMGTYKKLDPIVDEVNTHHEINTRDQREITTKNTVFQIKTQGKTFHDEKREKRERQSFLLQIRGRAKLCRSEIERLEGAGIKLDFWPKGDLEYLKEKSRQVYKNCKKKISDYMDEQKELDARKIIIEKKDREKLAEMGGMFSYNARSIMEILDETETEEEAKSEYRCKRYRLESAEWRLQDDVTREENNIKKALERINNLVYEIEKTKGEDWRILHEAEKNQWYRENLI